MKAFIPSSKLLVMFILIMWHFKGESAQCDSVFPTGLQSHTSGGQLVVNSNAHVYNITSPVLPFTNEIINANNGDSCVTDDCSASGSPATGIALPTFPSFSGGASKNIQTTILGEGTNNTDTYGYLTIDPGNTTDFSSNYNEYFIKGIVIEGTAKLNMRPGTYWVEDLTIKNGHAELNVVGNGTVYLYIKNNIIVNDNSEINGISASTVLSLNIYNNLNLNTNSTASGLVYVQGDTYIDNGTDFTGAISTNNLTLNSNSTVTYQNNLTRIYDFGNICTSTPLELIAHYKFEQSTWPSSGDVLDSSDNNNHGDPLGDIAPILDATPKSCQALEIENNSSSSQINAVDTGIDINSLGEDGTISFWYKSNNNWSSGGDRQLLDASYTSAGSKYFFLVLRNDGSLRFGLEYNGDDDIYSTTSTNSFAANEWVHIAVTWDPLNANLDIYINGVQSTTTDSIEAPNGGSIDELGTLHIGDNNTNYSVNGSSDNSANGYFDDVRVYDFRQQESEIKSDMEDVISCVDDPVAEYRFDEAIWNGTSGEVSDNTSGNLHGTAAGNASTITGGQVCRAGTYDGTGDYINVSGINSYLNTTATISFWIKTTQYGDDLHWRAPGITGVEEDQGTDDVFWGIIDASGYIQVQKGNGTPALSSSPINNGNWHHVVLTRNSSTGVVQVFINGVLDDTATSDTGDVSSNFSSIGKVDDNFGTMSFIGQLDELLIFDSVISASAVNSIYTNQRNGNNYDGSSRTCPTGPIHHYDISHPNQALTCSGANIEIKACENAACTQLSSAFVSLDFQANNTTYISNTIIGSTNFAYTNTTAETVTLSIANANEAPTQPITCNGSSASGACDLTFVDAGFEFFGATINDVFPDQVAANNFVNANIRAVRNNAGVCEPLLVGFKDITFSYECDTPNTCLTPFSNIPITNDTGKNSGTVNLEFDSSGVANLNALNYPDAGQIILSAEAEIDGATFSTTGEETIVVYPSYLQLSVDETELIYGGTGEQNNYIAGENFTFIVGAYGTNNQLLLNYETIDSGSDPELEVTRMSPANSGQNGNFKYSNIGTATATTTATYTNAAGLSFSGGKHSYSSAYYDEVGRIDINAQDNNYFGHVISSNGSLLIGDFYPAYYKVYASNTPTLHKTCNTFSYIGQKMTFATNPELTLTAYNALDNMTQNYSDNYWNYAPNKTTLETYLSFADTSSYALTGTASVIGLGDAPLIENNTNYNGSGTITITNSSFKYDKVDTNNNTYNLSTPFEASMNLSFASDFFMSTFTDQSTTQHTICHQNTYAEKACLGLSIEDITGTQMRYGRFVLDSNYGPETEGLTVPIKTEFYNANSFWQINNEDSCTSIEFSQNANELVLEGDAGVLAAVNEITSIGLLTAGVSPDPDNLFFNAPNIMGEVVLKLNPLLPAPNTKPYAWPSYLNYDWNADGVICNLGSCPDSINDTDSDPQLTDYPSATVSFGLFRGNDRIIQWREVFN